jgi:hypothetical protein
MVNRVLEFVWSRAVAFFERCNNLRRLMSVMRRIPLAGLSRMLVSSWAAVTNALV